LIHRDIFYLWWVLAYTIQTFSMPFGHAVSVGGDGPDGTVREFPCTVKLAPIFNRELAQSHR
jgi:hypothetical protein